MRRFLLILFLLVETLPLSQAQPGHQLLLVGTHSLNDDGYLAVPGPYGGQGQPGWIWQLIIDAAQDGANPPSIQPETFGQPTNDDFILASGRVGDSLYVPTNSSAIAFPLTYPAGLQENRIYVRLFGSDTLQVGTPYVETPSGAMPELPGGNLVPYALPIFTSERGGLMDRRLVTSMIPSELVANTELTGEEINTSLVLEDGTEVQVRVRFGGIGLNWLVLERFDTPVERWGGNHPPMERNIVVLYNQVRPFGEEWSASLTVPFTSDEVESTYGASVLPEDIRIYRETAEGWQEEPGHPINVGDQWEITATSSEAHFSGRWTLAPTGNGTSVEGDESRPLSFHLYPVYPSPFNPDTRIRFDLPGTMMVHLEVFDILGRRVTVLQDGVLPAGSHAFTFSGGHLASGTYFLRLRAGDHHAVQKMVLIR